MPCIIDSEWHCLPARSMRSRVYDTVEGPSAVRLSVPSMDSSSDVQLVSG